ncbi:glycosyltransferase [Aerosakkonema funiforme]|uniref:Glycosyltransferase n=1 Tax=Aerosakkonema funiforme FACHB-1375 TaxID=2949571 RepID=A0A926VI98_9CYAN|nr:glycosyltransferase [Aerosakkonema funiforme]MBD2184481.1 glycosyltransferase [Aerosakkonema funiforme FACHB-1375]
MKILFLDQSGKPGGAELCLLDIAKPYRDSCLIGLFADGSFRHLLEQHNIPVEVLATDPIAVRKESNLAQGLKSFGNLAPLIAKVVHLSRDRDLIYANTQKALVVGAIASFIARRPLVYHLHDIISPEHFSQTNIRIIVTLANRFASLVIANSQATQAAFIAAGGRGDITQVVYNGFTPEFYKNRDADIAQAKQRLGMNGRFLVGQFSRLSPWKGQHILLQALKRCPEDVAAILVGDALFGEEDYVKDLHEKVAAMGLENRVKFLGFQSDIVPLMKACDLVVHTSTAPEPFGRVIVEAMLCKRPVVAAKAGGAMELIATNKTGWLVPPGDAIALADAIVACRDRPENAATIVRNAEIEASERFNLTSINKQILQLLSGIIKN